MTRILRHVRIDAGPRVVGEAGGPTMLPEVEQMLAEAIAQAEASGFEQGMAAARAEAAARGSDLAAQTESAFREGVQSLVEWRRSDAGAAVALAMEIAAHVVGREPHDDGQVLSQRIGEALKDVDDGPLTVSVNPNDLEAVTAALAAWGDTSVLADGTLQPGEARVKGPWSSLDLTRAAAWRAVSEAAGIEEL